MLTRLKGLFQMKKKRLLLCGIIVCVLVVAITLVLTIPSKKSQTEGSYEEIWYEPLIEIDDPEIALTEFPYDEESLLEYPDMVLDIVNAEREKVGAAPLVMSEQINEAAALRAIELDTEFSHYRPDGTLCFTVFDEFDVPGRNRAENVAAGQRTPERVVAAWMASEGHQRNILNPDYTDIGIGVFQGDDGRIYWVQLFAG